MKNPSLIGVYAWIGLVAGLAPRALSADGEFDRWRAQVKPAQIVQVTGEQTKLSADKPGGWNKGTYLQRLQTLGPGSGVPANGAIDAKSLIVRHGDKTLTLDKDYLADPVWGSIGIGPSPSVTTEETVSVDYRVSLRRLDSVVRSADGVQSLRTGESHLTIPQPPALKPGETRLANIYVDYFQDGKTAQVFPVTESADKAPTLTTPGRIPRTLAKIKAGQPVKIVCWGDSVTEGGDATKPELAYPGVFQAKLRQMFPKADIHVQAVAVGGSGSLNWLHPDKYPFPSRPGACDWQRIVDAKPDLVTLEFVNDAGLSGTAFDQTYGEILARTKAIGAELVLITPHFVMPSWMGFKDLREPENRPYVLALRRLAEEQKLGLADASSRWAHLWKEGLPYPTMLTNGINHPDDRGHLLFAEELLKCFAD